MMKQTLSDISTGNSAPRNTHQDMVDQQGCLRDELDQPFAWPRHNNNVAAHYGDENDDERSFSSIQNSSVLHYVTARSGDTTDEEEWYDAFDDYKKDFEITGVNAQHSFDLEDDIDSDDYYRDYYDNDNLGLIGDVDSIHLRKTKLFKDEEEQPQNQQDCCDDFESTLFGGFGGFGEKDSLHRRERVSQFLSTKSSNQKQAQQLEDNHLFWDGAFGEHDSLHERKTYHKIMKQVAEELKVPEAEAEEDTEADERKPPYSLLMRRVCKHIHAGIQDEKLEEDEDQDGQEESLSSSQAGTTTRTCSSSVDYHLSKAIEIMEEFRRTHYADHEQIHSDANAVNYHYSSSDLTDDEEDDDFASLYSWEDDEPCASSSVATALPKTMADSVIPPLPSLPERSHRQDARAA